MNDETAAATTREHPGIVALLVVIYLAGRALMATTSWFSDLGYYFLAFLQQGHLPEYGPLASLLAGLPFWALPEVHPQPYFLGFKALALAADAFVALVVARTRSHLDTALYLVGSALLFRVWVDRLDIFVGAFLVVAVVARSTVAAGGAYGAVGLIKFPLLALAAVPVLRQRRAGLGVLASALGVFALGLGAHAAWLGGDAALAPFTFHAGRTLQREGLLGNLLDLGRLVAGLDLTVRYSHGGAHLHGPDDGLLRSAGLVALVGASLLTAWVIVRRGAALAPARALLLALLAYTAFNPIGSPQFAVPLMVLVPLALDARAERGLALLFLLYALTVELAFARYVHDVSGAEALRFAAWTAARNLTAVACWVALMARELTSRTPAPPA